MSDDGGPSATDPARWSDPDWRDHPAAAPFGGGVPTAPLWSGWMTRWGLTAGGLLAASAVAVLAIAPRWSEDGMAPWAVGAAVIAYAAIMSVYYFDRTSQTY